MRQLPVVPKLGVGVVWWPELDALCRPDEGLVQVIEAEPETFWRAPAQKASAVTSPLPDLLGHLPQPKLLHGVGAPFGGGPAQSLDHRRTLAADIAALRPAWISDHLSFDRFTHDAGDDAVFTRFFLPPAQCEAGVARAAAHIRHRRETTGVPVAFENAVSYLPPAPGEMPDGVYAAQVAESADCGILLDLHNVLCNERNGRQSVAEFCEAIPLDRVWEIHLAGGESERGFWLDAHTGLVEPALMDILAEIVPRLPSLGAIMFEIMQGSVAGIGLPAIADMLGRINDIWATCNTQAASADGRHASAPLSDMPEPLPPALWERLIGSAVTGHGAPALPDALAEWLQQAETSFDLYRSLAQEGRASSLVLAAPGTIRSLLRTAGEAETRRLLAQFWREAPPAYTSVEEGRAFLDFMSRARMAHAGLSGHIAADRSRLGL
jgi:uncharacterized protein (UPF0276 family)